MSASGLTAPVDISEAAVNRIVNCVPFIDNGSGVAETQAMLHALRATLAAAEKQVKELTVIKDAATLLETCDEYDMDNNYAALMKLVTPWTVRVEEKPRG